MLPKSLEAIVCDLESGHDVSTRLNKALNGSAKKPTRPQVLELVTRVLDTCCKCRSETNRKAFQVAISSLRDFVPLLKKSKKSLVDTIASVEKYAVNFALCPPPTTTEEATTLLEKGELTTSLRLIFSARAQTKTRSRVKTKLERHTLLEDCGEKENEDPQRQTFNVVSYPDERLTNELLYPEAAISGIDIFLPNNDSVDVSVAVAGALTVRLTSCCEDITLEQKRSLAEHLVVPWLQFLQGFRNESSLRLAKAYTKRVSSFLLDEARKSTSDHAVILQTRLFALKLDDCKLNRFAKELLQSVNCFNRASKQERREMKKTEIVAEAYDDALRFVTKYDSCDKRWLSEDVSAWLDNVGVVFSSLVPRKPLPSVFINRIQLCKKEEPEAALLGCFELQVDMINVGAYALTRKPDPMNEEAVWDYIAHLRNDVLDETPITMGVRNRSSLNPDDWSLAEKQALQCLRLLRTLEPLRRVIASSVNKRDLPAGAERVLLVYIRGLLRGFSILSIESPRGGSFGTKALAEVSSRLHKMVGGGMESSRDLIRVYGNNQHLTDLEDVVCSTSHILKHHRDHSQEETRRWTEWFGSVLSSTMKENAEKMVTDVSDHNERRIYFTAMVDTIISCSKEISMRTWDADVLCPGHFKVLSVVREVLRSSQFWFASADLSLRLFESLTVPFRPDVSAHTIEDVARMVAQDMVKLAYSGEPLSFLKEAPLSAEVLLAIFVQYNCWVRQNHSLFKTHRKYLETLDGLICCRGAVFEHCNMSHPPCSLMSTHAWWLRYIDSSQTNRTTVSTDFWEASAEGKCTGHNSMWVDMNAAERLCSPSKYEYVHSLQTLCDRVTSKSFAELTGIIEKMQPLLSHNKDVNECRELMTISMEILQWTAMVSASRNYARIARCALQVSTECATFLNIHSPLSNATGLCNRIDNLPVSLFEHFTEDVKEGLTPRDDFQVLYDSSLSESLETETSNLKQSIKALRVSESIRHRERSQGISIGGLSVNLTFNLCSESGQHRADLILNVVLHLFRLASLQLAIENLPEARYYMEKCISVTSECLPSANYSFRKLATLSSRFCVTGGNAVDSKTLDSELTLESNVGGRSRISLYNLVHTLADVLLEEEVQSRNCNATALVLEEPRVDVALRLLNRCEQLFEGDERNSALDSDTEIELFRLHMSLGTAYRMKSEDKAAFEFLKPLADKDPRGVSCERAIVLYQVAQLHLDQIGDLHKCLDLSLEDQSGKQVRVTHRKTRSQSRTFRDVPISGTQASIKEARSSIARAVDNIRQCREHIGLSRQLLLLTTILNVDITSAWPHLAKSIGISFNARLSLSARCKEKKPRRKPSTQKGYSHDQPLHELLQSLNINDAVSPVDRSNLSGLNHALRNTKSVLLGLSINKERSCLVIWRQCAIGCTARRLWIPSSGPLSYRGVVQRIQNILLKVKNSSIAEGQKLTRAQKIAWWEERHELDVEMERVLRDIQEVWLGEAVALLLPSIVDRSVHKAARGQDVYAEYTELAQRLQNIDSGNCTLEEDLCRTQDSRHERRDHPVSLGQLILLLDTPCEGIPWESLPLLRDFCVSATRTPSLLYLARNWNPDRRVDPSSVFYVLNPDDNLSRTEERFRDEFNSHKGWSGLTGNTSGEQVAASYEKEQVFLYCGHGAGEEYFQPARICSNSNAPIALLMGCSSARPRYLGRGDCESNGPAVEFLLHEAPAVVGNLWDVSDGEIDRLTSSVLSLWLGGVTEEPHKQPVSLAQAVALSRPKCRLPYLVGASCVVMGVPHILTALCD